MAMVKLWNDNVHPYKEKFREKDFNIPAKSYIKLEAGEAHLLLTSFIPIMIDHDGKPDPRGFKMLRIEPITAEMEEEKADPKSELVCQACRYEGASAKDLAEHVKAQHSDQLLVDEEAEAAMRAKKKAKVAAR